MANNAKGLGKGLGALMGDVSLQSQEGGSVTLPIAQIEPGLNQPRKHFDADSLDVVDMIMSLEDEFGIEVPDEEVEKLHTVGDVVRFIDANT